DATRRRFDEAAWTRFEPMGRARVFEEFADPREVVDRMESGDKRPSIDLEPAGAAHVHRASPGATGTTPSRLARVVVDRPGEFEFDVDPSADGILVVSEKWYPGWKVWRDAASWQDVGRANGVFLAVEADRPQVRLAYRPGWLTPTLAVSALGFLASVLL